MLLTLSLFILKLWVLFFSIHNPIVSEKGELPTYPELVTKLSNYIEYQKQTNQLNARMNTFNGMIGVFNYVKSRNLQVRKFIMNLLS